MAKNSITTEGRFKSAIQKASTMNSAISLVTAIHKADINELLDELQEQHPAASELITALRKEYTK